MISKLSYYIMWGFIFVFSYRTIIWKHSFFFFFNTQGVSHMQYKHLRVYNNWIYCYYFFPRKGNSIFWIFPYKNQLLQSSLPEIKEWRAENILHAFQISPQVIFSAQCWSTRYMVAKLNSKNNYTYFVSVLINKQV